MQKTVIREHGLDDFDEEEKLVDPVVIIGFSTVFLAVAGLSLAPILQMLF